MTERSGGLSMYVPSVRVVRVQGDDEVVGATHDDDRSRITTSSSHVITSTHARGFFLTAKISYCYDGTNHDND